MYTMYIHMCDDLTSLLAVALPLLGAQESSSSSTKRGATSRTSRGLARTDAPDSQSKNQNLESEGISPDI